jgi:hypothetical protein
MEPAQTEPVQTGLAQKNPEDAGAAGVSKAVESPARTESDEPFLWYKTWWFWAAASALVAGSLTTGLVLGLPPNVQSSGQVVLTIRP